MINDATRTTAEKMAKANGLAVRFERKGVRFSTIGGDYKAIDVPLRGDEKHPERIFSAAITTLLWHVGRRDRGFTVNRD